MPSSSCPGPVRPELGLAGFAVLLLSLLANVRLSAALPFYFLNASRVVIPSDQKCIAHPSTLNRRHASLMLDSGITFEVTSSAATTPTDVLCPGGEHTLKVSFGNVSRVALLNSNPPLANFSSPTPTAGCPNQVILGFPAANTSFTTTFNVPCNASGSNLLFKVTSVDRNDFAWKHNSISLPVADVSSPAVAPGGVCAAAAAACSLGRTCSRSSLGYDCMATWRNVTIHWSFNTSSAPENACTPTIKTALSAAELATSGSLHMAVQSLATGYVALGFAAVAGVMVPSDIIMGWVGSDLAPVVGTFDASVNGLLPDNNNTDNTWAYDRGVALDAATGATTMCFSRRLADDRAKARPDLRSSGPVLPINFAVSEQDALVKHKPGSVGGFHLDLLRGVVALPPPPPPPPSSPPAGDLTVAAAALPPPRPAPPSSNCTPSTLGYSCMTQRGKVTLHWTINAATAPSNPCTPAAKTTLQETEIAQYGALHVAVQSETQGYVGLGFAEDPDRMYRSDIALGWVEGAGSGWFRTFYATGNGMDAGDIVSPSWAYDTGVVRDATTGVTTICFSRRLLDSRAKAKPDLREAAGVGAGAGGSGSPVGGRRHLSQEGDSVASPVMGLIWAISPKTELVEHRGSDVGGFYLDLASGEVRAPGGGKSKSFWINVHGALMAVAWGLLLPLGTLLPAHRWLLGETKLAGKHLWFWAHIACQGSGMALFIAGFVVAFVKFGSVSGDIVRAHQKIGIAIMAAAGAQVVLGFARPDLDSPRRPAWNLLHHNLGRATVLLAWANVYIGIYCYNSSWSASYAAWITPIAIVMGLLVLADVVLRLVGARRQSEPEASIRADVYMGPTDGTGMAAKAATPAASC